MISLWSSLLVVHLLGLALGTGAATVKVVLLLKCGGDLAFVPVYVKVARLITRQIILGMVLLTLSGVGWLLIGYPFSGQLALKLVLVALLWVMGPIIDNVAEPRFKKLVPAPGEPRSAEFIRAQHQYLALEIGATLLFYVITVAWVLR